MTDAEENEKLQFADDSDDQNEAGDGIPVEERSLRTQAYDKSISDIISMIRDGDIILDPEYQRNYVWDNKKASLLIESVLLNVPIPIIYVAEDDDSRWTVVDGLQRLNTLRRFFDNEFKLRSLEILTELNGAQFSTLNPKAIRILKNGILRMILIFKESHPDIKYDIFMRLNRGAVKLNEQELRNCLEEVNTLLTLVNALATDDPAKETKFAALLKSSLVLLTGKFEAFVETISEDYIFAINELKLNAGQIPLHLKIQHTFRAIQNCDHLRQKEKHPEAEILFTSLAVLWTPNVSAPELNVDCNFSYGKHGEESLRKLFRNIGIDNIFETIVLVRNQESLLQQGQEGEVTPVDFKGTFNSMTNIRNNVLHQDATPSLSATQVQEYSSLIYDFATALDAKLYEFVAALKV